MQTDRLEPAGACKGPCSHGERAETPTQRLAPLREGDKVTVALDATVVYGPRDIDGRCLVETDEGVYLLVDRFRVERR